MSINKKTECPMARVFIILEGMAFKEELSGNNFSKFTEDGYSAVARDMFCACLCSEKKSCCSNNNLKMGRNSQIGISNGEVISTVKAYLAQNECEGFVAEEILPVIKFHIHMHMVYHHIDNYTSAIWNFMDMFFQLAERLKAVENTVLVEACA